MQTAGNTLRFFIYDPVYEGRLIRDPSHAPALNRRRRSLGVAAAFIVSGLMHEHLYLCALAFGWCEAELRKCAGGFSSVPAHQRGLICKLTAWCKSSNGFTRS